MKVIAFSGSLRKESFTTKLLKAFEKQAPEGVAFELVDISTLPFINQDLEQDLPPAVRDLHAKIRGADAVLFATPEYNRSYSPVLKNAIDWGSRPYGQNAWNGLPAGVGSASPGLLGGFGAAHHLRQTLIFPNLAAMPQPEFYLSLAAEKFDESGNLTDETTRQRIDEFWTAFVRWAERNKREAQLVFGER